MENQDEKTAPQCCCNKTERPRAIFFSLSCCGGPEVMFAWLALKKKIAAAGGFKNYVCGFFRK